MIDAKENKAFTKKINDNSLKKFSKDIQKYTAIILIALIIIYIFTKSSNNMRYDFLIYPLEKI